MKGYIYTMFSGADPAIGWKMTDPIFGAVPTMGACMPNIRHAVQSGDHIFVISGRVEGVRQYVVGGFEVDQKIDAMAAYHRFPENRMTIGTEGLLAGNVIVDADGNQSSLDYHSSFKNRIENYIVGKNPIVLQTKPEISAAREQTVGALGDVLGKPGETPKDIVGRWRRLDERQITRLVDWLRSVKGRS